MILPKKFYGFTLIEIIISMSLAGVLLVTMFASLLFVREKLTKQNLRSKESLIAMKVIGQITRELNNARFENWNFDSYFISQKQFIDGKRIDHLKFMTTSPWSNPSAMTSESYTVEYKAIKNNEGFFLGRREFINNRINEFDQKSPWIPVLNNIEEFTLSLGVKDSNYIDDWNTKKYKKLPRYIKLSLKWEQGGKPQKFTWKVSPPIAWN